MAKLVDYDYYQSIKKVDKDIDIRQQVKDIIYGNDEKGEKPNSMWVVHRVLRRDERGRPIKSGTVDTASGQPDLLTYTGQITDISGYLFDDKLIRVSYQLSRVLFQDEDVIDAGLDMSKKVIFITTYDDRPLRQDEFIQIETDEAGTPVSPFKLIDRYVISNVYPMANDYGRIEYWLVLGERQEL